MELRKLLDKRDLSERSAQQRSITHRRVKCFDAGEESVMGHPVWERGSSEGTEWKLEVQVLKGVCSCKALSLVRAALCCGDVSVGVACA